jgi:hypothetical protein
VLLSEPISLPQLHGALAVLGGGMGLSMTGFIVAVQGAAPARRMGIATSSVQFFRSLGGAVGVSALGAVMLGGLRSQGIDPGNLSPVAEAAAGGSPPIPPQALMSALRGVFVSGLTFALGGLVAGFSMPGGSARLHAHPSSR